MKLSILNLVPVREGQNYQQAMAAMVALAQYAESIGIERYWIAEHHNMKNLASSATSLLIQEQSITPEEAFEQVQNDSAHLFN